VKVRRGVSYFGKRGQDWAIAAKYGITTVVWAGWAKFDLNDLNVAPAGGCGRGFAAGTRRRPLFLAATVAFCLSLGRRTVSRRMIGYCAISTGVLVAGPWPVMQHDFFPSLAPSFLHLFAVGVTVAGHVEAPMGRLPTSLPATPRCP
jgi:hypothetical protein